MDSFEIVMHAERPDLADTSIAFDGENYPAFIEEDAVWHEVSPSFYEEFSELQFFVVDKAAEGTLVASVRNVAFDWSGVPDDLPGYHDMLRGAVAMRRLGSVANTLSAVEVVINPAYRGQGLSRLIVGHLEVIAKNSGLKRITSALRPALKERYPLLPITDYAEWRRDDGELFDPWLRSFERMGFTMIKSEPASTVIEGSVAQWEEWTDLCFPVSGEYWIPGGLSTLLIDLEKDRGVHNEPHVWCEHRGAVQSL